MLYHINLIIHSSIYFTFYILIRAIDRLMHPCTSLGVTTLKAFRTSDSMSNSSPLANLFNRYRLNMALTELKQVSMGFNSGEYETLNITVIFSYSQSSFTALTRCTDS